MANELKTVLVTGGSQGIGHSAVERFLSSGWRVYTCSRHPYSQDQCGKIDKENYFHINLNNRHEITDGIKKIRVCLDGTPLNALVNNAGISPKSEAGKRMASVETEMSIWDQVFQVNFFAPIMLVRGLIKELKKGKASIVNITSIAGSRVQPFAGSAYATSKAALSALTREMSSDLGPYGIRVNSVSPGEINTSILSPGTEKLVDNIPLGRLGEPDEIAEIVYFLCSEKSCYISGTEVHVNGGEHV
ncbi:MAG TPA: SDR family oxidoreductase [Victivallales bacterium]|nr:SDR family oxidoreductase [Victivallales bacterium]